MRSFYLAVILFFFSGYSFAVQPYDDGAVHKDSGNVYIDHPWAVFAFHGWTTENALSEHLLLHYDRDDEEIYAFEVSRVIQLEPENWWRQFLDFIWVDEFEVLGNFAYRSDDREGRNDISEFIVAVMVRWTEFPWHHYVDTSFGLAEGLSFVTDTPFVEIEKTHNQAERFLNYMAFELTLAPPSYPQLELVARIHHRSSAWGLFAERGYGNNAPGLGLRYRF